MDSGRKLEEVYGSVPRVLGIGENGIFVEMPDVDGERLESEEDSNFLHNFFLQMYTFQKEAFYTHNVFVRFT